MGELSSEQNDMIRKFLEASGLTFKPLQDEMFDHVSSDIEDRMEHGLSFEQAWLQACSDIPDNHFQNIQNETMESINKRFTLAMPFSYIALALLFMSTAFKMLRLPLSGELLIVSFIVIAVALITASLSEVKSNREKKGKVRIMGILSGITLMMIGYAFKMMHLPGADQFIGAAVVILILAFIANTIYVYRYASGEGNLFTYLHERYSPGIERFLLILLVPLAAYRVVLISIDSSVYVGAMILLIVIFGAGLQFISMSWRIVEKDLSKRNWFTLLLMAVTTLCFTLVFLGPIMPLKARIVMIMIFSLASASQASHLEEMTKSFVKSALAFLPAVIFILWGLIRLEILPTDLFRWIFNIPLLAALLAGVFVMPKNGLLRTYFIILFASYLFEYVTQ